MTGAARKILLDENMPRGLADDLAAAGHDVQKVSSLAAGIDDRAVLDLARRSGRWLLTFDSDFGDLVFHRGEAPPPAILYFRLHPIVESDLLTLALRALAHGAAAGFIVVTRESTRVRPFNTVPSDEGI